MSERALLGWAEPLKASIGATSAEIRCPGARGAPGCTESRGARRKARHLSAELPKAGSSGSSRTGTIVWRRWRRCDDDLAWVTVTIVAGERAVSRGLAPPALFGDRRAAAAPAWLAPAETSTQLAVLAVLCCDNFGLFFQISSLCVFSTRVITKACTYPCVLCPGLFCFSWISVSKILNPFWRTVQSSKDSEKTIENYSWSTDLVWIFPSLMAVFLLYWIEFCLRWKEVCFRKLYKNGAFTKSSL